MVLLFLCGDKLVGELDNVETLCHLIITNKLENATVIIPNPFDFNSTISVYINLNKKTENDVSFINGYPYIECNVNISGDILSIDESVDLTDPSALQTINSYVNTYLEDNITSYLYKTAKEFKSDIANFGQYVLPKYATWEDWIASDWLNNYQNSFFTVNVNTNIQSGYLFNKI